MEGVFPAARPSHVSVQEEICNPGIQVSARCWEEKICRPVIAGVHRLRALGFVRPLQVTPVAIEFNQFKLKHPQL